VAQIKAGKKVFSDDKDINLRLLFKVIYGMKIL